MSFPFILILAAAALFIWTIGVFSFWRIGEKAKRRAAATVPQPALRLADQWLADSQAKIRRLADASEQPLSAAQNELLELRLEAGRLPQGVKSLKLVREALASPFQPKYPGKGLAEIVKSYLGVEDHRVEDGDLVFLKTSLGEMVCLELGGGEVDGALKSALARLSRAAGRDASTGGFLFFNDAVRYREFLGNAHWTEGIKTQRLMAIDPAGLSAILLSLRLSRDADKVVQVFQTGVDSTRALTGQSDRMGEALSQLSGDTVKLRALMDGSGHGP